MEKRLWSISLENASKVWISSRGSAMCGFELGVMGKWRRKLNEHRKTGASRV
ncbi:hypothetical protein K443DRAFT_675178 [Laccaria amethystina LaAM-08-1]|uniref:Uncharacterized protein n=1 Tax=Laccaria amethystina LaAM-08-1 TaxID=1095629 RepID=A0A0C9YBA1_9AGAR|nr:hypothetical protein K443DRAFT_675178 [Laccaria amethystina LaAM-08-1]